MPDPFSIATGVVALVGSSYKFSKDIYELIDGIQSAPGHIRNISDDLKALYSTLGTLDSLLRDEQISQNALMRDLSANLEEALKNCVRVFREVGVVINEYVRKNGTGSSGIWAKTKWTFKEKEIGALRDHLTTYKATCMMAINTATYVRTIETNALAQRIQEDTAINSQQTQNTLAFIIRRLEAMEAQRQPTNIPLPDDDYEHIGGEESEYNFRMRRFMFETASVLSGSPRGSIIMTEFSGRAVSPSINTSLVDEGENEVEDDPDTGLTDQDYAGDHSSEKFLSEESPKPETANNEGIIIESMVAKEEEPGIAIPYLNSMGQARPSPLVSPTQLPTESRKILANVSVSPLGFSETSYSPGSVQSRISSPSHSTGTSDFMVPRKFTVPRKEIKPEQATSGSAVREHIPRPVLSSSSQVILPRFQPVLDRIDSHKKRKYQEGYFLKLDDQDIDGKPSSNRAWTECFAQLIGTVLHLWDATELDVATEDGEVKQQLFLNLTDASLKMIETLPTKSGPLQNILSISSAGRNRYLLHFNGHHSMVQWTAAMRLTMFEHQILQEAYTSSLISNETDAWGRNSPVLSSLMKKRSTAKHEGWVRIRFGAGTTWRRCWTVVKPPDDKKYLKLRREYQKAGHPPEMEPPMLKGHIKFYDVKSKRKTPPIAEIKNATYAYAVYPEQAALVESSTLIKMEGTITVFSSRPTSVESYVFAMPDLHAGKTGYITMVQWLFPIWDTFALYGRPEVIGSKYTDNPASTLPKDWDGHVSYSYMEVRDVVGLIMTEGSATWKESEWRQRLKETDAQRMLTKDVDPPT